AEATLTGLILFSVVAIGVASVLDGGPESDPLPALGSEGSRFSTAAVTAVAVGQRRGVVAYPSPPRVKKAQRYARSNDGLLSFAVIDDRNRLRGFEGNRKYVSASVVKVMLLAAELRRLRREGLDLDPLTSQVLEAMITVSDNNAADEIYYRVGDHGLNEVARKSGMDDFSVSGYWANARITAAGMARFMRGLGQNLPGVHGGWAKGLLASIADDQSWGIPEALGHEWRVFFKGGWRGTGLGEMVHQVALLRHRNGTKSSLAVLSDGQESQGEAMENVRRIATVLYGEPPARGS
ncbi:MAG: serine hydrolase, partial [Solirubrobacterales bacterium]|nr:serine hydrolase [Solirubrobacterales bacterium]